MFDIWPMEEEHIFKQEHQNGGAKPHVDTHIQEALQLHKVHYIKDQKGCQPLPRS